MKRVLILASLLCTAPAFGQVPEQPPQSPQEAAGSALLHQAVQRELLTASEVIFLRRQVATLQLQVKTVSEERDALKKKSEPASAAGAQPATPSQ